MAFGCLGALHQAALESHQCHPATVSAHLPPETGTRVLCFVLVDASVRLRLVDLIFQSGKICSSDVTGAFILLKSPAEILCAQLLRPLPPGLAVARFLLEE